MKTVLLLLATFIFFSCANLPKSGWYKNSTTGARIHVAMTGSEEQIKAAYQDRFTKDDFLSAFAKTRSSQFLNEGKPKYYAVVSETPDRPETMRIIAVEVLERDFKHE